MLPTKRSAIALARGARTGVWMMRTSAAVKTASKRGGELGVAVPMREAHGSVVRRDQQAAHRRGRGRQDTPPPRSVDDLGCGGREAGLTVHEAVHELECHHAADASNGMNPAGRFGWCLLCADLQVYS